MEQFNINFTLILTWAGYEPAHHSSSRTDPRNPSLRSGTVCLGHHELCFPYTISQNTVYLHTHFPTELDLKTILPNYEIKDHMMAENHIRQTQNKTIVLK